MNELVRKLGYYYYASDQSVRIASMWHYSKYNPYIIYQGFTYNKLNVDSSGMLTITGYNE